MRRQLRRCHQATPRVPATWKGAPWCPDPLFPPQSCPTSMYDILYKETLHFMLIFITTILIIPRQHSRGGYTIFTIHEICLSGNPTVSATFSKSVALQAFNLLLFFTRCGEINCPCCTLLALDKLLFSLLVHGQVKKSRGLS